MNYATIITTSITAVIELLKFIKSAKEAAKQTGELTAEQDAEFDKLLEDGMAKYNWQPEGN